jgi:hypothetical protein
MNQERTIIGACDYSIASLQNIRAALLDYGNSQKELNWAMGGLIVTLVSHLMRLCHETFVEATQSDSASAVNDMQAIQSKFNDFMQRMIDNV